MEKIKETISSQKGKKISYILCAAVLLGWVIFRFAAIGAENSLAVFNASRVAADVGAPVQVIEVTSQEGSLKEPIAVHNNRAYVASSRVSKLHAGQRIGDGVIVSVSADIDLDSGMHVVRTRGVTNGLQYAEFKAKGYFVPAYAVKDGKVLVAENGVAELRPVSVVRQDSDTAYISDGLNDGDVVILSKVNAGDKVQIKK